MTPEDIWILVLATIVEILFASGIGIYCSATSPTQLHALFKTYFLMTICLVVFYIGSVAFLSPFFFVIGFSPWTLNITVGVLALSAAVAGFIAAATRSS